MNFQTIPPVERTKVMLDLAFRKAREKGKQKKLVGNWLQIIRKKECMKIDIIKDSLVPRLEKILHTFPETMKLPEFYVSLMKLTLDFAQLKKSFGAVNWAIEKIRFFQGMYCRKIVACKDRAKIKGLSREFYGRICSLLKQIEPQLQYLEECRKILRTYPDVKQMPTVCVYGFPNVGKTTLLNSLTGTRAKVAAYSFTTKSINAGYMKVDGKKIQVLDVPGTLARKEKMNNIELQAELVLKELADVVVYVFDLSGTCGITLKRQEQLLQKVGKKKPLFIYVSKKDITSKDLLEEFAHTHYGREELKKKLAGALRD